MACLFKMPQGISSNELLCKPLCQPYVLPWWFHHTDGSRCYRGTAMSLLEGCIFIYTWASDDSQLHGFLWPSTVEKYCNNPSLHSSSFLCDWAATPKLYLLMKCNALFARKKEPDSTNIPLSSLAFFRCYRFVSRYISKRTVIRTRINAFRPITLSAICLNQQSAPMKAISNDVVPCQGKSPACQPKMQISLEEILK